MRLNAETFRTVVDAAPLVSIDLVVENGQGEILLGKRLNRPAQGTWFVPGGRVQKNETLDAAFARLTQEELGRASDRSKAIFLGVFEHFYEDGAFGAAPLNPSTHYVVLAYRLPCPSDATDSLPLTQHARFQWWSNGQASASDEVHPYAKAYLETTNKE